jgi:hypothetical protein
MSNAITRPNTFNSLQEYISSSREKYQACIDVIGTNIRVSGIDATLRFHHLKFDSNGQPKVADLANCLADHIIQYCFSARRRGNPKTDDEFSRLNREARKLLRKWTTSGESGEILLYLLIEVVLEAPQLVAKYDLKTNPKMESLGSDGIHMKWHASDGVLDIYFGEAKLEQSISKALDDTFKSLNSFHAEGLQEHECGLITSHFKWVDEKLRKEVLNYVDRQKPAKDCRINHACLIGYDWSEYKKMGDFKLDALTAEFKQRYLADTSRIIKLLEKRFSDFEHKHLRFEVFFLPFRTVQEFRDAFNNAVS